VSIAVDTNAIESDSENAIRPLEKGEFAMPVSNRCVFHPDANATGRCKKCGNPICDACKMQTGIGVFCGIQCAEEAEKFQAKVSNAMPVYQTRLGCGRMIKGLITLAGVLGVFYAVMFWIYGMTDPMEMVEKFIDQIKKLINIMT
jgi:hypothetical protein